MGLGFKVGHATRNLDQCLELSKSDLTIRTSILEARYVHGYKDLYEKLVQRFNTEIVAKTADEFIEMKLDERDKDIVHMVHRASLLSQMLKKVREG